VNTNYLIDKHFLFALLLRNLAAVALAAPFSPPVNKKKAKETILFV